MDEKKILTEEGPKPSPFLKDVSAYEPPKSRYPIELFLDANEGIAPPAEILDAVVKEGTEILRRYPDAGPLQAEIARSNGIDEGQVLVTAGADDALERCLRAYLAPGRDLVVPTPTFGMIPRYAKLAGASMIAVSWENGPFPSDALLDAVTPETTLIAVVTPNSPTGLVIDLADLERISSEVPQALLLVDLAYTEFADLDLTSAILKLPNAVVTRTFSKAWGLAGLRVGWVAGPSEIIRNLNAAGHPFAVSSPSLALTLERIRTGREDMMRFVSKIQDQRRSLAEFLEGFGVSSIPSQANFVLATFKDAFSVRDQLAEIGIAVRSFPGKKNLENCLRITLPGSDSAYKKLCSSLEQVLKNGQEQ